MKLSKIKAAHIQAIYSNMLSSGLSPQTVRRNHVAINSVFRYAYKMGIVQENICDRIELPKIKEVEKLRYFTLEQSRNFLNYLTKPLEYTYKAHDRIHQNGTPYKVKEYTQKKPIPLQFYVYYTLAIYGGFRRGELIGLKWSDVDFKKETISINRSISKTKALGQIEKSTKTKAGKRTLKMPSVCFNILKEWQKEQKLLSMNLGTAWKGHRGKDFKDNYIFIKLDSGERMDLDTPGKKFKKIIENYNSLCESETDKLPNIRLHDLRHTQATLLLSQGVDIETVAHRMGHSKASVTLDVYGHWMEETDSKAAETLSKMFQEA